MENLKVFANTLITVLVRLTTKVGTTNDVISSYIMISYFLCLYFYKHLSVLWIP